MHILRVIVFVAALACTFAGNATGNAEQSGPLLCFNDVLATQWQRSEEGQRRQAMLLCAQLGASVLAVLDAVDSRAVAASEAGRTARQLAFNVVSLALTEIEGRYQAAGAKSPSTEQFRTYVPDSYEALSANKRQLKALVNEVWQEPRIARTDYPAVSQRIVDKWVATTMSQRPEPYQR